MVDNPVDNPLPVVRFRPDRRVMIAAAGGLVVVLALLLLADDGPSRLLFGIGAVVLAAFVVGDLAYSPRLEASAQGVVVRSPLARVVLAWPQVEVVRADTRPRLGLRSTTLEVDAGETLVVLSRRAIGAEPEDAARLINAFRPPG